MKIFDFLYYLFYKVKGGPASGTVAIVIWYYVVAGCYLVSYINNFFFFREEVIYVIGISGVLIFVFFIYIYRNTEEMKTRMLAFDGMNRVLAFFIAYTMNFLPLIVSLIILYRQLSER